MEERELQYGEKVQFEPGQRLYKPGDSVDPAPIYYIVAGLIKIEFTISSGSNFPLYLLPDSVFGQIEPLLECDRLTSVYCMEKTQLYRWDTESFDIASSVSWELALTTITGLTQMLRILNAEFGDKIGLIGNKI
jgi:CRP-like cAMP-binding protein